MVVEITLETLFCKAQVKLIFTNFIVLYLVPCEEYIYIPEEGLSTLKFLTRTSVPYALYHIISVLL